VIETQPRPTIRTVVASFLFTDLVGFSKGTAADQYAAKARLSAVLQRNLAVLQPSDYWIKDTGDGALIAFVSNPEHSLYMALALAHEYAQPTEGAASSSLRTGLHLGTVKESIDVEARRNFIGDGINAAKRIMDFADPGQIAASGSYFEAIANLDSAYAALFRHVGAPDDKHGRAHELYALSPSSSVLDKLRADFGGERPAGADTRVGPEDAEVATAPSAIDSRTGARISRPMLLIAIAAVLAIASAFVVMQMSPPPSRSGVAATESSTGSATPQTKKDEATAAATNGSPKATAPASERREVLPVTPPPTAIVPEPRRTPEPAEQNARSAAVAPAATPRAAPESKLRASTPPPVSDTSGATGRSSPRCSRIVEKAALGEPLTPDEQRELANSCR